MAAFVALAVAFDYFTVTAVHTVGFEGIPRAVAAIVCVVVGTVAAHIQVALLIRVVAKYDKPVARS